MVLIVFSFTILRPYYRGWGLGGVAEMVWTQFRFLYLSCFISVTSL